MIGNRLQIASVFLGLLLISPWRAEAKGEGQKVLLSRGSLLHQEFKRGSLTTGQTLFDRQESRNTIFPEVDEIDYKKYTEIVKRLRIDVVSPGRGLLYLMNTVSTNILSQLLADYDDKFARMNIGEISRPMLRAYLSVQLASNEDISSWSRLRGARNISGGCKSLLEKRDETLREQLGEINSSERQEFYRLVEHLKEREPDTFHLALLVFKNNLNLFLLESFLALCNRVELDEEVQEAFASYESLI